MSCENQYCFMHGVRGVCMVNIENWDDKCQTKKLYESNRNSPKAESAETSDNKAMIAIALMDKLQAGYVKCDNTVEIASFVVDVLNEWHSTTIAICGTLE